VLYSRPSQYAIRALANLAAYPTGSFRMTSDLAQEEGIPSPYLGKILQGLARAGVLRSQKGPGGGFSLAREPRQILLIDIIEAAEGTESLHSCAVGLAECNDEQPCPLHDHWKAVRDQIRDYLEKTSLYELGQALTRKKELAGKTPAPATRVGAPTTTSSL
jgi:Rrf2 family protein